MDATQIPVDQDMMVRVRRQLHMHPEMEWELPLTAALVRETLDAIGVPYEYERYGKHTIVATINPEKKGFTIGIRADMDALPIQEANEDKPYRSRHDGIMHACGHDAHTAMLLGTAKALHALRDQIDCRVRLLFQPCEESRPSGAQTMCRAGVMDDIDCIIMCHVNCNDASGVPSCCAGVTNATSSRFAITTHGRAVHVASPHRGVDALAMGTKIYAGIQLMLAREVDPFDTCVLSVCTMHAGTTSAVNADRCEMTGSIRCLKDGTMAWAKARLARLARAVCDEMGGSCDIDFFGDPLPAAYNDTAMHAAFVRSAEKIAGKGGVAPLLPSPGGEDFAYYEQHRPGLLFGLGMRDEAQGFIQAAHTKDWDIEEGAMETGVRLFVQFVLDNMHGVREDAP